MDKAGQGTILAAKMVFVALLSAGLLYFKLTPGLQVIAAGAVQPVSAWRTLSGDPRDAAALQSLMRRLMGECRVTAMSVAVIDGGRPVVSRTLGFTDRARVLPAGDRTVFRAASLSKPVFAYLVMRLVDRGVLDLDKPVEKYLDKPIYEFPAYAGFREDPRCRRLTARLLLSHQGGLPNWRRVRPDGPLLFESNPGDRFAYSGEGYRLLQFVIENATGQDLAELARREIFQPLEMTDTSFLWEPRFDGRFAYELDSPLRRFLEATRKTGNAAYSLVTNASDYSRFLAAVVSGQGLSPRGHATMLERQVSITSKSLFSPPGTDPGLNRSHQLGWALGWGIFTDAHGRAIFHVGREEGCENYSVAFLDRGLGLAIFSMTNSAASFSEPLVDFVVGKAYSPLPWLEYGASTWRERIAPALLVLVVCLALGVIAITARRRRTAPTK